MCPALAAAAPCEKPDTEVWNAVASDAGLTACFQSGSSCWKFDGTQWTPAAANATPKPDDSDNRGLGKVTDSSADGKRTVVKSDDGFQLQLVDAATKKRIATIPRWKTAMWDNGFRIWGFAGDALVAWMSYSPVSSSARLYDRGGKLLALLGTSDITEGAALDLGKSQWLFNEFEGTEAYVYDVTSGKRLATIALASKRSRKEGGRIGDAIIALAGDKVWAMQGPADAGAVVYDVATRKQKQVPLPLCK